MVILERALSPLGPKIVAHQGVLELLPVPKIEQTKLLAIHQPNQYWHYTCTCRLQYSEIVMHYMQYVFCITRDVFFAY